jgi:hypothetical protein
MIAPIGSDGVWRLHIVGDIDLLERFVQFSLLF